MDVEKVELWYTAGWNVKMTQLLGKAVWWFSKWFNIEVTCEPAISLPLRCQEDENIHPHKNSSTGVHSSLIHNTKGGNGHQLILGDKMWYGRTLKTLCLSERSQSQKERTVRFHPQRVSLGEVKCRKTELRWWSHNPVNILKKSELYTLNGWTMWNEIISQCRP